MQQALIKIIIFSLLFIALPTPRTATAAVLARPPSNLGLVGYWNFDEGVGTVAGDSSGNGNNGTLVGGVEWTDGKRGKALKLDGSSGYVNAGNKDSFNFGTQDFSVSFWIKTNDSRSNVGIINKYGSNGSVTTGFVVRMFNGEVCTHFQDVSSNVACNTTSGNTYVGNNEWNFVTVNYRRSSDAEFYINGTLKHTVNISSRSGSISNNANLTFGTHSFRLDGFLDDVRIYNRALSSGEIARLYSSGQATRKTVSNQGLVGYWSFDEGAGTVAGDSSGNGNNGTIIGATWTDGKRGKALSFDGINSYVDVNLINSGLTGSQTISAWMKSNGPPTGKPHQTVLATDNTYLYGVKLMTYKNINRVGLWVGNGSSAYEAFVNANVNDGKWHFVSGVYDYNAGTVTIFIDGVAYSPINSGQITVNISTFGKIGRDYHNSDYSYNGLIDDVRIYNRALSAGEIQKLYEQSSATINSSQNNKMTDGLVGLWSFDGKDISGTTAYDRSGQGNNGTITGAKPTIGKIGQALEFDGTNQYVIINDSDNLDVTKITMSAWVKGNSWAGADRRGVIIKGTYYLTIVPTGKIEVFAYGKSPAGYHSSGATLETNRWYHILCTIDQTGFSIYIDGQLDKFISATGNITVNANNLAIGSEWNGLNRFFNGSIDDVRIYNRALSAEEVKQLYLIGK